MNVLEQLTLYVNPIKGYLYMLFGNLLTTLANYLYKYATANKIYPTTLIMYRGVYFCIYSTIAIALSDKKVKKEFQLSKIKPLLIRSLISSIGKTMAVFALMNLRVSTFEILLRTGNTLGVFTGYLFLNEVITGYDIQGILGSLIGVIFILKPSIFFGNQDDGKTGDNQLGIMLGLGVASIFIFATVLTKTVMKVFNEFYLTFLMGLMAIIFSMVYALIIGLDMAVEFHTIYFTFFITFFDFSGMVFIFRAYSLEDITKLTPFSNSKILYSMVINYVLFNNIDIFDVIGASIIICVYVYISYKKIVAKKVN